MATNGQLLSKALRGEQLMESEIMQVERAWDEQEAYSLKLRDWLAENNGVVKPVLPMEIIFSEILSAATTSLEIAIPQNFKHIWIIGAGRTTGAGTSSDYLYAQLENDTGTNYINQFFSAVSTTLTGTRTTGQDHALIGTLAQGGRGAGDVCTFSTIIPNINSAELDKNVISDNALPFGATFNLTSNWNSVSAVNTIKLYSSADDIAAGSYISVYGLL